MRDLFIESNPGPIKFAMSKMGLGENRLRLPLVPVSSATEAKVEEAMARAGIRKGELA
jgi:4-hydroxy-tetrahydrodipicolinate synthase